MIAYDGEAVKTPASAITAREIAQNTSVTVWQHFGFNLNGKMRLICVQSLGYTNIDESELKSAGGYLSYSKRL